MISSEMRLSVALDGSYDLNGLGVTLKVMGKRVRHEL
jgi:hypothetical protein